MSIKKARKLGFWAALSILLGSVIGTGIFFKNGSIAKITGHNGTAWLLSWLIGGILALSLAISFSEIGTLKLEDSKTQGVSKWANVVVNKVFGKFTQFQYTLFYSASLGVAICFFSSEAFFEILISAGLISKNVPIYAHVLFTTFIMASIVFVNITSLKASNIIQKITVILKFFPIILAILIGIIMASTNIAAGSEKGFNAFTHPQSNFNISSVFMALPAVLFAYDGFLHVATMQNDIKSGDKQVPKILLVGIIIIIICNCLIAVASILHNSTSIFKILDNTLPVSARKPFTVFIYILIFISAYGATNGYISGLWSGIGQAVENELICGTKKIINKLGATKTRISFLLSIIFFWMLFFSIPSLIFNTDAIIDCGSNWPTFFMFIILSIIILYYSLKRKKINSIKIKNIVFYIVSFISVIGILSLLLFSISYKTIYLGLILHPNEVSNYGLFSRKGGITNLGSAILFFVQTFVFFLLPYLNDLPQRIKNKKTLIHKIKKEYKLYLNQK